MPHVRRRSIPVLLTVLAVALAGQSSASAKTERYEIPDGAKVAIDGKGFGHGRGLSQYGAQGAARAGLDHRAIVEFYYPGTEWGTAKGNVSVNITGDTTDDLVVRPRSGLKVRDIAGKKVYTLPANGAAYWRAAVNRKSGITKIQWQMPGKKAWRTHLSWYGEAQFGAAGRPITLVTPTKQVSYRGILRHAAPVKGQKARDTVNVLSMEHYLRGVVPLEIPASWDPEAVRAQAVAARTYATFERSNPLARHYQICDTTQCQVYGGQSAENPKANDAIAATARQVLTYGGSPAFTQFGSSNGGWAAPGSMPYQVAKADPYDGWSGNPVHDWTVTVTRERLEQTWPTLGTLERISVTGRSGTGEWGGRVQGITLVGSDRKVRISGDQMRSALGLRSTLFTFRVVEPKKSPKN